MAFRSLSLLCLALIACGDDSTETPGVDAAVAVDAAADADTSPRPITIRFEPRVGAQPFACGTSYPAQGAEATTITPRDFRFYLHDIALLDADGAKVPVVLDQDGAWQFEDTALLDFEDFTGGCVDGTVETNRTLRGTVPNRVYTGLSFTIGVPERFNHVDLTTQPAPLNLTGLWWGWSFGHIFFAAVSHADLEADANDHYVHIGSVDCTGDPSLGETATCAKPNRPAIELRGFDPLTAPVVADYGVILSRSNLATSIGCHSFTEEPCAWPFDLIGLNWFTGSQTPTTQKVFRTE